MSSVEPLRSANKAVTVLRSPSMLSGVALSVLGRKLIAFSGVCASVSGDDLGRTEPQESQNFAVSRLLAPHFEQRIHHPLPMGQQFKFGYISEQCGDGRCQTAYQILAYPHNSSWQPGRAFSTRRRSLERLRSFLIRRFACLPAGADWI
jgi:hypothetical protein